MQTMVENYLDLTVEEVYDVITKINVWPSGFTIEMKIKFINGMIKHFEDREEYEKSRDFGQTAECSRCCRPAD